jgi:hypothetical protein
MCILRQQLLCWRRDRVIYDMERDAGSVRRTGELVARAGPQTAQKRDALPWTGRFANLRR